MIYAFFASLSWGVSYYCFSLLSPKIPYWALILTLVPLHLTAAALGYHTQKTNFETLSQNTTVIFFYMIATALGNLFVYLAFKNCDSFIATSIEMTYPVVIMFLLFLFSNRTISKEDVLGLLLIFIGVLVINKNQ